MNGKLTPYIGGAVIEALVPVLRRPAELPDISSFKVASYNVYNLFGEDAERPAPKKQLQAIGAMIREINPDAIAFQEVENETVLRALFRQYVNSRLGEDERYDAFVYVPANDRRGINVALVTRLSVRGALTFHDREFGPEDESAVKFSRDLLGVELNATRDYKFLFFVGHLKSKIGGESAEAKRGMEASEIRTIFAEPAFGGAPFIQQDMLLAGDMNDSPDSRVIEILSGDGQLKDLLSEQDQPSYPTHKRYAPTRLDYIFASPSMAKRAAEPTVYTEGPVAQASDHRPVSAVVKIIAGD